MAQKAFKTLYHLANNEIDVLEIKRLDLPDAADKAQLFHWLLIEKNTPAQRLHFVSMSSENGKKYRRFDKGELTFDDKQGSFKAKKEHLLKSKNPTDLPHGITELVLDYLP